MTYRQICIVKDNQVVVNLPPDFENKKQVTVIIDSIIDSRTQKLNKLKEATTDPLFLADVLEVQKDFDYIDSESI